MKLYRFEKATEKRCESLRRSNLWVSSPSFFNDLYDCRFVLDQSRATVFSVNKIKDAFTLLYSGEVHPRDLSLDILNKALMDIERKGEPETHADGSVNLSKYFTNEKSIQEEIMEKHGVVCFFSENVKNPLMWAHYGDNHAGFCVEYEVDELQRDLFEVEYSTKHPRVTYEELIFCPHRTAERILTTKNIVWAYEKEYRIIKQLKKNEKNGAPIQFPDWLRPKKVIMGYRIKSVDREITENKNDFKIDECFPYWHVSNVAASLGVPLYQMDLVDNVFIEKLQVKR